MGKASYIAIVKVDVKVADASVEDLTVFVIVVVTKTCLVKT